MTRVSFVPLALGVVAVGVTIASQAPRSGGGGRAKAPELARTVSDAERGAVGTSPRAASDVRMPGRILPEDSTGGASQVLKDLTGAEGGGFAVVWQDQRDGMLGIELRRLAPNGEPLEKEQPIHDCTSGRSLDPVVAVAPDGSGAVAWISARSYLAPRVWMRPFDAQGRFLAAAKPVEVARPSVRGGAGGRDGASRPVIVRRREGGYAIAWVETGGVRMLEVDPAGVWRDRPGTVAPAGASPPLGVELGAARGGGVLCAFTYGDGWRATTLGKAAAPLAGGAGGAGGTGRGCGAGELERLEPDSGEGFWGWFGSADGYELRRLKPNGDPDLPMVRPLASAAGSDEKDRHADFAVWRGGIAVLETGAGGELLLHLLDAEGKRLEPDPTRVSPPGSTAIGDARIASNGRLLYVAWTDRRGGDSDVFGRSIDPGAASDRRLGPETRLNTDEASSDQIRPCLAGCGTRSIVAWQDHREGRAQVFARRAVFPEGPTGPEFRIPVGSAPGDAARTRPATAILDTGESLVAWIEGGQEGLSLHAQVLDAEGAAARGDVLLQPVAREPSRIAAAALPERRGFLAVFDVPGEGEVRLARIGLAGEPLAETTRLGGGTGKLVSDPCVAVLDDGRAVACWSRQSKDKTWSIASRFVDADGAPIGDEIEIEPSPRGMDWEPFAAAGADGGFVLAWTAGTREAAVRGEEWRDVVARSFDSQGHAQGPLLAVSTLNGEQDHPEVVRLSDRTWAVAWEDDLSGFDQIHLRRILNAGTELGPTVRLTSPGTGCSPNHQSPHIAPAGDGLAALWSSSARSKGWDVELAFFGPRFDAPRTR